MSWKSDLIDLAERKERRKLLLFAAACLRQAMLYPGAPDSAAELVEAIERHTDRKLAPQEIDAVVSRLGQRARNMLESEPGFLAAFCAGDNLERLQQGKYLRVRLA